MGVMPGLWMIDLKQLSGTSSMERLLQYYYYPYQNLHNTRENFANIISRIMVET